MKKLIPILLILAILIACTACSEPKNKPYEPNSDTSTSTSSATRESESIDTTTSTDTSSKIDISIPEGSFLLSEETDPANAGGEMFFSYKKSNTQQNMSDMNVRFAEPSEVVSDSEDKAALLVKMPFHSITAITKNGNTICLHVSSDSPSQVFEIEVKASDIAGVTQFTYHEITP